MKLFSPSALAIIAGSSLALGACVPAGLLPKPATPSPEPSQSMSQSQLEGEFKEVAAAVQSGEAVECELTKEGDPTQIMYQIKGQKLRMTTANNPAGDAFMTVDGEYVYTWNPDTKQGMKFKVEPTENQTETEEPEQQAVPDFTNPELQEQFAQENLSMSCEPTQLSDDIFTPPSDIEFADLGAMMQQFGQPNQ